MNAPVRTNFTLLSDDDFRREAVRILRRLSEPGACLAYAADMEKAVVVRDTADGRTVRTAVTSQKTVQSMVVLDWLTCTTPGRVARYHLTGAGQAALKRLLSEMAENGTEFAEDATPFADQHREWETREFRVPDSERTRRVKYNSSESPVAVIARRKDKDGNPFLSADLVIAAERLREDFELSQMGPRIGQNWDKFLTGGDRGTFGGGDSGNTSVERAKDRVMGALRHLGPGLSDVALRVCCFLDGVETAEKKLGWSARSGKVVLRIALQRLHRYYQSNGTEDKIG